MTEWDDAQARGEAISRHRKTTELSLEQYGVKFRDGSVRAPWNGSTQRERAEEELQRLQEAYPIDAPHFQLVWRPHRATVWRPAPILVTPPKKRS